MKFKTGNRVKLISMIWLDGKHNPLWNGEHGKVIGTIILIGKGSGNNLNYTVCWDNDGLNIYYENDIELYQANHLPEELFTL